jgi:hypothetical protein
MLHRQDHRLKNAANFGGFMHKLAKAMLPAVVVGLLILGTGTAVMAGECFYCPPITSVPEIDPAMAASAMTLIGGAVLIIRGRRKK